MNKRQEIVFLEEGDDNPYVMTNSLRVVNILRSIEGAITEGEVEAIKSLDYAVIDGSQRANQFISILRIFPDIQIKKFTTHPVNLSMSLIESFREQLGEFIEE